MLRYLVEKGLELDGNILSENPHRTALQLAAVNGRKKAILYLLDLGADINAGRVGETLLCGFESHDRPTVDLLLDRGAKIADDASRRCSVICEAIAHDMEDLVPLLIERGADVNFLESTRSPLGLAIAYSKREVVDLLQPHMARLGETDTHVLIQAVRRRSLDGLQELLDLGIDPNIHNRRLIPIEVSSLRHSSRDRQARQSDMKADDD